MSPSSAALRVLLACLLVAAGAVAVLYATAQPRFAAATQILGLPTPHPSTAQGRATVAAAERVLGELGVPRLAVAYDNASVCNTEADAIPAVACERTVLGRPAIFLESGSYSAAQGIDAQFEQIVAHELVHTLQTPADRAYLAADANWPRLPTNGEPSGVEGVADCASVLLLVRDGLITRGQLGDVELGYMTDGCTTAQYQDALALIEGRLGQPQ